jgi:dihydroflavonol-4-reductase
VKVLVTGATGFIGFHLVRFLREKGLHVRALVRRDTDDSCVRSLDAETVRGDVRDLKSVVNALQGCAHVYHVAADYRLWVPDPGRMYETNVEGTKNVLEAALMLRVEKVVYTSTVGVLTGATHGRPADERSAACIEDMVGHYKRSKFLAEREAYGFINKGVPVVIVNPSTPIGEMDRKPTPTGKMIVDFLNGRIPAYIDTGLNFIDVQDVAAGHWLAAVKGRTGERYILGNKNITLRDFFETLALIAGRKPPRIRLPYLPVLLAAHIDEAVSNWVTHRPPAIPVTGVRMAGKFMYFDASKAVAELQLPQTPVKLAMEKAVEWYRKHGYAKN